MAGFTTYLQQKLLDHARGKTSYTMPSVWVSLWTATPTVTAGSGTETVYTNYVRIPTAGADWTAASGTNGTNTNPFTFAACGTTGATIFAFALGDAVSAGNIMAFGACSLVISSGITPSFAAGQLTMTLT